MTVITVPKIPIVASIGDITTGSSVLGSTWRSEMDAINYLTAKGGQLVCCNQPNTEIAAGGSHTFRYYAWPRAIHSRRVWVLSITSVGARAVVTVQDGATPAASYRSSLVTLAGGGSWNTLANQPEPITYIGEYTPTSTPGEITLSIAAASVNVVVYRVACFELPRARLEIGASENAAAYAGPGFAIYETSESALYGIAQAVDAGRTGMLRANFHWYDATGSTTTSGSFANIFALPPKVVAPAGSTVGGTTRSVSWAARVVTTGGAAEAKVTAASGGTSTLTANGAAAWYTGTITIDREDLTDDDTGGQAARLLGDSLTFQTRVTTGSSMTITGLAVGNGAVS